MLPSYSGYVQRLNRLSAVFAPLAEDVLAAIQPGRGRRDNPYRRFNADHAGRRRALLSSYGGPSAGYQGLLRFQEDFLLWGEAACGRSATTGEPPSFRAVGLSPGSASDLSALRQVLPRLTGGQLYGDKAYCDGPMKARLLEEQNLERLTPVKKKKGQEHLSAADKLFSEAVSRVRQPIGSFFSWIDEKTGIQCASKVRSYRGLLVHTFGRLAAAMLLLAFNS